MVLTDPAMLLLAFFLLTFGISAAFLDYLFKQARPVEASSASGNLAELVVLR